MNKKQLRKQIIQKLRAKNVEEKRQIENKLNTTLFSSALWKKSKVIGITISNDIEWDTTCIIKEAWDKGKIVCAPKTYPDEHKLVFYTINSFEQLKTQYYGLQEPDPTQTIAFEKKLIDLLIVPGLLFDKNGFRLGFGGGYYDRFLVDFPNVTISLLSKIQLIDQIPTEPFDIPIDYLIVEDELVK